MLSLSTTTTATTFIINQIPRISPLLTVLIHRHNSSCAAPHYQPPRARRRCKTRHKMSSFTEYRTIDIESYLSSVEERVRSFDDITYVTLTEQHRKTMLQTLLNYSNKIEFDKAARERKNELEHTKMANFVTQELNPTIRPLENATIQTKAPNYHAGMEFALGCDPSLKGVPRRFSRMASGPAYRGNLTNMLQDVAPELMPKYEEAKRSLEDVEVTSSLIRSSNVSEQLKEAAMLCLGMDLSSGSSPVMNSQKIGVDCERLCIEYLKRQHPRKNKDNDLVFENVYVLKTSEPGRLNGSDHKTQWAKNPESAVITTDTDRGGVCSEFDGVIVKLLEQQEEQQQQQQQQQQQSSEMKVEGYVTEIWESKTSLNPSTIMDAILKKMSSVRSLVEEESSLLVYKDGYAALKPDQTKQFGIFGLELSSVDKAVSQMKVIACQEALKDVNVVLEALETNMIRVRSSAVIEKLVALRGILEEMNDFSVVLVLADLETKD